MTSILSPVTRLSTHNAQFTWRVGDRVWKAFAGPIHPYDVLLPHIYGVEPWTHFFYPTADQHRELDLPQGDWLIAERRFVPGECLTASADLNQMTRVAYILRDLHEIGLPHGDLQPHNIVVGDEVTFIDVALYPGAPNRVAGSAPFMAPEAWEAKTADARSDIYALGCIFYWMLQGHLPFHSESLSGWAKTHLTDAPRPMSDPPQDGTQRASKDITAIILRMLDKAPSNRPQIQEVIDVLTTTSTGVSPPPMVIGHDPYTAWIQEVMDASGHVLVRDAHPTTQLFDTLARRFELCKTPVVELTNTGTSTAWDVLAHAASRLNLQTRESITGDRLRVFRHWLDVLSHGRVVLIWGDTLALSPDLRAWIVFALENADASQLRLVGPLGDLRISSDHLSVRNVPTIGADFWRQWRSQTLRVEVRDIAQRRFEELVRLHGKTPEAMRDALNAEFDIAQTRAPLQLDTAQLRSIATTWQEDAKQKLAACAFGEVATLCEAVFNAAARRKTPTIDVAKVLEIWAEAILRGARDEDYVQAILNALSHAHTPHEAILKARLLHALGRHTEGLETLNALDDSAPVSLWRAQLTLSAGLFEDATTYAQAGLLLDPSPQLALQLHILRIAPTAMRGSLVAIEELKDLIAGLDHDTDPMVAARAHAYRAIGMTRAGHLDDAVDAHLRALEIVEQAGLDGELPTFLLNAGTAYHRQGRLGLAREFYARGARISTPLTRQSTRALLLANQANIDLILARYVPAAENIARAKTIAQNHQLHTVSVMCQTLEGDLHYALKDYSCAIETYRAALELHTSSSQRTELELALSQSYLSVENLLDATHHLNSARKLIEDEKLADHEPLHGMLRARIQWSDGSNLNTMGGIELFRRSLRSAYDSGNHKLVLQQTPFLAAQLAREDMPELLHEAAELAQGSRNAVAMGLTGELRRDFFATLPTIPVSPPAAPKSAPQVKAQLPSADAFYRLLSFNEVILRARTLDALLPDALEIGLSLSGAERAFILLREDERFKIVASRDVNGEPIDAPHLSVSQTIAEEAARTGRTVLTLNARDDHRFNSALSVVDLELSSVLCVPIRDAGGLLGALYLDHRYRHGNFDGEVPRMMEAYGHQLAIALTNLRHIEDLHNERERLAALNTELDSLAAERAVLLEGLKEQVAQLHDEVQKERSRTQRPAMEGLVYVSRAMENLREQVTRVARGDIAVVLHGESGVGKELIARAIHSESLRAPKPFIALNCGAISETLMESELFGHVKGAFTGAESDRRGMFHAAHGGTLFLDEVAEMPLSMQVKLLRVLQEKMVRRVGSNATEAVDVRVLAATHRDLKKMVREGTFREDLYYRIATLTLEIPPLRERPEDIVPIARHVLDRAGTESGRFVVLTTEAALTLTRAPWPGNVRELENVLRAAAILSEDDRLRSSDLTPLIQTTEVFGTQRTVSVQVPKTTRGRKSKVTPEQVNAALEQFAGDREAAAKHLGISLRTLFRVLAK